MVSYYCQNITSTGRAERRGRGEGAGRGVVGGSSYSDFDADLSQNCSTIVKQSDRERASTTASFVNRTGSLYCRALKDKRERERERERESTAAYNYFLSASQAVDCRLLNYPAAYSGTDLLRQL